MPPEVEVKRVLLIDDDELFRKSLTMVIASMGYEVLTAESGERALQLLESASVDLLVADYQLPGITGLDVIRRGREKGLTIPMLLLSASLNEETVALAKKESVTALFKKSTDQLRLLRPTISKLLEGGAAFVDSPIG